MLEQKDLHAIAEIVNAGFAKTEEMIKETNERVSRIEQKVYEVESNLTSKIENVERKLSNRIEMAERNISEVESMLVNELVKTEDILSRRMDKLEKNMEELNHNFQIQNRHTALILEEYNKRLVRLETKTA